MGRLILATLVETSPLQNSQISIATLSINPLQKQLFVTSNTDEISLSYVLALNDVLLLLLAPIGCFDR
jgi:hypothetical protein